ncbi:mechanosensitive ion channel domain-containing protein [Persephonella sp.]|uniref:mechanosensitive ion channel family protein n=1 Tax=Persephonella sp. TaxID=2060922 RepID=UPI0026379DB7|nr:mechanosensitive ion channel domain-containing protein [Persephonella sp.]
MMYQKVILYVALIVLTIAGFFVLKKLTPRVLKKLQKKFSIRERDVVILGDIFIKTVGILVFIILFNLIAHFPYLDKYFEKYVISLLKTSIIETESIKLSIYSIIRGIIIFYSLLLITKFFRKILEIYFYYKAKGEEVATTIDILVYHFALVIIVLITLSAMGITWKLLIPIAGALGIGIGFGIQDIVNNFISGFILLLGKTIKRGDWISIGDQFGKIIDIGVRTSVLRTLDNIDIIIPNSHLVSNKLINWSHTDPVVRIHIPVGVSYNSDVEKVKMTLLEVAEKAPFVLKNRPREARFVEFGDSSLNFELLVWINVKRTPIPLAKSELNYRIWYAFKEKGIEIPYPQRDIWFKNKLIIQKEKDEKDTTSKKSDS